MFGISDKYLTVIYSLFAKNTAIEKAILYGSRAKGNYRNGSDIDICLVGVELDLTTVQKLEIEIDDLFIPYKVDFSIFHKIKNTDLIEHINRVGIILYKKTN